METLSGMAKHTRNHVARENKHMARKSVIEPLREDEIYEFIEKQDEPLILILDGIQDAHNLGACMRTADAAGAHIVIAPREHTIGMTETVRRISCGAADVLPYVQVGNLNLVINRLKEMGVFVVGTSDQFSVPFYEASMNGPLAIVMGSESNGIRRKTAEKCDSLVHIPMHGKIDCLNLSVATGICLFEVVRQRGSRK